MNIDFNIGTVKRFGKVMKADIYADKGVDITPDDIKNMIEKFSPVNVKVEHVNSIFDGKLGKLVHLGADSSFDHLFGVVEWPEWVDKALENDEKKVSLGLNKDKLIEELSLVVKPRVEGANVNDRFATAFSKSEEEEIDMTLEDIKAAMKEVFAANKVEEKPPVVAPKFSESPEYKAMEERVKASETLAASIIDNGYREKAKDFSQRQFDAGKLDDKKKVEVETLFYNALKSDAVSIAAGVKFSDTQPSQAETIKNIYDAMPSSNLHQELFGGHPTTEFSYSESDLKSLDDATEQFSKRMNRSK